VALNWFCYSDIRHLLCSRRTAGEWHHVLSCHVMPSEDILFYISKSRVFFRTIFACEVGLKLQLVMSTVVFSEGTQFTSTKPPRVLTTIRSSFISHTGVVILPRLGLDLFLPLLLQSVILQPTYHWRYVIWDTGSVVRYNPEKISYENCFQFHIKFSSLPHSLHALCCGQNRAEFHGNFIVASRFSHVCF
jgi:hypothetical protein